MPEEPKVLDYREMTDEQKAMLDRNVKGCSELLDSLVDLVIDHREDCDCPNGLCVGTDVLHVRSMVNATQEHMLLSMALSRLADQQIVTEMNERLT